VAVTYLSDSVATRLRKHHFKCRVVQVAIKDINLKSITRQTTLPAPTHLSRDIADAALDLIAKHWKKGNPIRTLTITGENLVPVDKAEGAQLSLFDEPLEQKSERKEKLEQALDLIRNRYGSKAVIQGNILGNDLGISDKD
jgi:DNA polymerase-4